MLDITLNWTPNPDTVTKLIDLANQQQKSLEALLEEAVLQYFQLHDPEPLNVEDDPIVGFCSGSSDLGTRAEEILTAELQSNHLH